ncbi:MAG: GNAT family N-acetyltransferase [Gemmataceae bacterium]
MLTIRPARESDVAALVALARRSWVGAFATAPVAFVRDRLRREFERDWYPRYWPYMAVAEEGGVVVGLVQPAGDEVNGLWVEPAAQGRGVGTALLRHAERGIAAAGYGRAWLTCSGFNPGAVRFYLARGYVEVGHESKDRGGGVVEDVLQLEHRFTPATG